MGNSRGMDKRIYQVGFAVISLMVGGILGAIYQEFVTDAINSTLVAMLVILVLIVTIAAMLSVVFKYVLRLSRPRARVRYFEFPPDHEAGLYHAASKVVRLARDIPSRRAIVE